MRISIALKIVLVGYGVLLMTSGLAAAQSSKSAGTLIVKITGMKSNDGRVLVHLFRPSDDVRGKLFLRASQKIIRGASVVKFSNLPYKNYYAMAFHDKNGNGILDHNSLRLPSEPLGFSNNWRATLFSGMPTYKKIKFTFSKNAPPISIRVTKFP